jgi:hypothetical protein
MSQDEFTKGPYRSGILTKEEEESILVSFHNTEIRPYKQFHEKQKKYVRNKLTRLGKNQFRGLHRVI